MGLLQVVLDDSDPNDQSFLRHTGEPLYVAAWFLRAYATVHTAAKADEGDCEVCELRRPDLCHTGSYRDGYARNAFMFFFSQNIRMDRKSCSTTRRFVGQSPFPDGVKVGVPLHSCCERGRATIRLGSRNARTMTHKPQYTSPTSQRTEHAGHMSPAHFMCSTPLRRSRRKQDCWTTSTLRLPLCEASLQSICNMRSIHSSVFSISEIVRVHWHGFHMCGSFHFPKCWKSFCWYVDGFSGRNLKVVATRIETCAHPCTF